MDLRLFTGAGLATAEACLATTGAAATVGLATGLADEGRAADAFGMECRFLLGLGWTCLTTTEYFRI